jgi:GT2 family glycosyltransferase/glycosyltransferase involved in cell wall biosynthesis
MYPGVYFDVTFLAFGRDLRGIPQVILQLVRLFEKEAAFEGMCYVSTPEVTRDFLLPLGVPPERIEHLSRVPVLGRFERFHGLFSTFRYRGINARARLLIHPELRTVTRSPVPQVVFFYDFIALEPGGGGEVRKWLRYLPLLYKNRQAARARFKVAISEFTRRRALELFPGMDPASIVSRLLGSRMRPADRPKEAPTQGRPLRFLYVGSYDRRKNIPSLVRNLGAVAGRREACLHLAGRMGEERERHLRELAKALPAHVGVSFHGLVSDGELADLYRECDFLLFPSLFEGFGLPLAEAMAQGMVACAFRNSSLPEVAGDAAILAENGDFAAWGRAIEILCADPEAFREASLRALSRAGEFTEEKMHERYGSYMLDVLRSVGIAAAIAGDPRIAVVIVNYRNTEDTVECLASLLSGGGEPTLRLFVVDNGSGDGSAERLAEAMARLAPGGRLLALEENLGFAGGCNVAIRSALEEGCTHVVLLNNDTRVDPDFVPALRRAVAEHPEDVLGGYIGRMDGGGPALNLGSISRWTGLIRYHTLDRLAPMPPFDFISGCLAVIPAGAFRAAGMMREDFFMYCEDLEFSLRLKAAGVRLRYVPELGVRHKVASTVGRTDFPKDYYRMRNQTFTVMSRSGIARKCVYLVRVLGALILNARDRRLFREFRLGLADGLAGRLGHRPDIAGKIRS